MNVCPEGRGPAQPRLAHSTPGLAAGPGRVPRAGCCFSGSFPFFTEMLIRKSIFMSKISFFFWLNLKEMMKKQYALGFHHLFRKRKLGCVVSSYLRCSACAPGSLWCPPAALLPQEPHNTGGWSLQGHSWAQAS